MALTEVVQNEELNSIFKSLAERGKDGEIYKKFNDCFTGGCLPQFSSKSNKSEFDIDRIMFKAYGSAAENLQCYDPCDAGDMDFMVFSNCDDLIIQEEMLEYSLENPLHVRIKGSDHPVLKSCLVKDTEYVATSALKNFHPTIFGSTPPLLVSFFSLFCQLTSLEEEAHLFTAQLHNNVTSPAVTLNMSHLIGAISKYWEMLKVDSINTPVNEAAAEAECIVHFLCEENGIEYTREHAELLNEFLLFIQDVGHVSSNFSLFIFYPQLNDRIKTIRDKLRAINSRSRHETVHTIDKQVVKPDKSDNEESGGNVVNCTAGVSTATQNSAVDQMRSTEDVGPTSSQSTTPRNSVECSHRLSEKAMSKGVTKIHDVEGNIEDTEKSGDYNKHTNVSNTEQELLEKTERLTSTDKPCNLDGKEVNESAGLKRRFCRWLDNMFGTLREKLLTQSKNTRRVTSGADFIPAFRSRGWPRNAREWIKRERKWPSIDIVTRVIQEGFHLVVKSPKENGTPECDFRISFSHAEYLLSQEMNDIQRECYRCLKRYHRAYLSSQPKSLVSFHLKNIFLQTIEESGAEMWSDRNRGHCMMKLLGNLLEALTKKDLPHFFVRSYNLFSVDYIENPEILESLARKVEEIIENPVRFAKQLMENQEESKQIEEEKSVSKKKVPGSESCMSRKPAGGQGQGEIEETPSEGRCDTQCRKERVTVSLRPTETTRGCCPAVYRYHDLHDIYQEVTKQLVDMIIDADCRHKAMDPLEMSLVEDLTELVSEYGIPVRVFSKMFNTYWHKRAYYWIWISNEPDMRHRILVAIQGLVELLKNHLKKDDFWQADNAEELEALIDRMLDPAAEHLLESRHAIPSGNFIHFVNGVAKMLDKHNPSQVESRTSLVENLRELVTTFLDFGGHSGVIPHLSETFTGLMDNEPLDVLFGFQGLLELAKQHVLEKDDVQQGGSDESAEDLPERMFDLINSLINSFISSRAQPNAVCRTDEIPLD